MPITRTRHVTLLLALVVSAALTERTELRAQTADTISYTVRVTEPEHHWLQVEAVFSSLGQAPLSARMSRSSPGRYATHEFAKNVSQVEAFDSGGRRLTVTRPDVDEWRIDDHDGSVRLVYRIFGDRADGTYMAVDTTHAHLNMPAAFLWGVGLEQRPIRVRFVPPAGSGWTVGTQLFSTTDPFTFTAPNLQYFMDSPTELANLTHTSFTVPDGGRDVRFRLIAHTTATQADLEALAVLVERLVREARQTFGVFPDFEPGHYTFLLDYVPWGDDDAMEHRNSTYITDSGVSLATPTGRLAALEAMAHEFFHVWNVERIRPVGLEPFDFTRQNITCCLWLAEGFTEYYGPLLLTRAGLGDTLPFAGVTTVTTAAPGMDRSLVAMSEHGPFADAGVANDVDDRARTFISYYTYGSAIALALDLSIREHTGGRRSLDDFMRRLWVDFGQPAPPRPGYVARPYSLPELRRLLGDVVGDAAFANHFFDRYIEGREVPDFEHLLALAGFTLERQAPERGWIGTFDVRETGNGLLVGGNRSTGPGSVVPYGTPAYRAGLDRGDLVLALDGQPATLSAWLGIGRRQPGDRVSLTVVRRDGRRDGLSVVVASDPSVRIRPTETRTALTPDQVSFRRAWLQAPAP